MEAGLTQGSAAAERLSALVDGEVDAAAATAACAHWKDDGEARRAWHAYHLIGDVLRSEDLASSPARDLGFLVSLRARLTVEPVILAPAPLPPVDRPDTAVMWPAGRRDVPARCWLLPSAVAAGFMLVLGTFAVLRPGAAPEVTPSAVALLDAASRPRPVPTVGPADAAATVVMNGRIVRDARLERYLAAHKQFAGTSALGVPSVFLRSATVDVEPR